MDKTHTRGKNKLHKIQNFMFYVFNMPITMITQVQERLNKQVQQLYGKVGTEQFVKGEDWNGQVMPGEPITVVSKWYQ